MDDLFGRDCAGVNRGHVYVFPGRMAYSIGNIYKKNQQLKEGLQKQEILKAQRRTAELSAMPQFRFAEPEE